MGSGKMPREGHAEGELWSDQFQARMSTQPWTLPVEGTSGALAAREAMQQTQAVTPCTGPVASHERLLTEALLPTRSKRFAKHDWPSLRSTSFAPQTQGLEYEHAGAHQRYAAQGPCTPMLLPCGHHAAQHVLTELAVSAASSDSASTCPACEAPFCSEDLVEHAILRSLMQPAAVEAQPVQTSQVCSAALQALAQDVMRWQQSASLLDGMLSAPFHRADGVTLHHVQLDGQQCVVKRFIDVDNADRAAAAMWHLLITTTLQSDGEVKRPAAAPLVFWSYRTTTVCVVTHRYPATLADVLRKHAVSGGLLVPHAVELAFQLSEALVSMHTCVARHHDRGAGVRGVAHGLVQPANVLVPRDGSHVALCGFGNSALLTDSMAVRPQVLSAQMEDDTAWAACELVHAAQHDAAAQAVSAKTDTWGVASVLMYLVTGALSMHMLSMQYASLRA